MNRLAETVMDAVSRYNMIETGDLVLAAVSGGPDSICMLDLLVGMRQRMGIELRVVHVDHVTRDGESAADARFVETVADRYGLECVSLRADVEGQRKNGESFEDAARRVRYAAFEDAALRSDACTVATAHTADDQAETVLMRVVRGVGPQGVTGIPPVSIRDGFRVVRPLIDVWRNDIETYLQDRSLDVRRDCTNETECCLRNKVRLRLIPMLEQEFNPAVKTALVRLANLSRDEQTFLKSIAREMTEPVTTAGDERRVTVARPEFRRLPKPVARRGIMGWAEQVVGRPWRGSAESVDAICNLLSSDSTTGRTCFVDGLSVRLEYDNGIIESAAETEQYAEPEPVVLDVPGRADVPWAGRAIVVRYRPRHDIAADISSVCGPDIQYFDADKVSGSIEIRRRHDGDSFCPIGLGGTVKLSDYLIDSKVPVRLRDSIPILCSGDTIMWVVGCRADERYAVDDSTVNLIEVMVETL